MAEPARDEPAQSDTDKRKRQTAREVSCLKVAAAALFIHDPSIDNLEELALHASLRDGLRMLPAGTLQRWALEGDWHGQRNRKAQHMRLRLQSMVGDAHLERQRKHIEQMSNIYNLAGQHLTNLRPKSFEQMMQARIRALELVHTWENDLRRANIDTIPSDREDAPSESRQATIIDKMTDCDVRKVFEVVLLQGQGNSE